MRTKTPEPGWIGLSTIGGWTGFWIKIGQVLINDGSRYTHAFVVVDDEFVLEAAPGGTKFVPLSKYLGKSPFIETGNFDQIDVQFVAHDLQGVPYSFLDYLALALAHFGIRPKFLTNYIKNTGHMICSQFADEFMLRLDKHMFDDGRMSQDVSPGDLANVELERGWI